MPEITRIEGISVCSDCVVMQWCSEDLDCDLFGYKVFIRNYNRGGGNTDLFTEKKILNNMFGIVMHRNNMMGCYYFR